MLSSSAISSQALAEGQYQYFALKVFFCLEDKRKNPGDTAASAQSYGRPSSRKL
jgi:hypothetical protein